MTRTRLFIVLAFLVIGGAMAATAVYLTQRSPDITATDEASCASVREVSSSTAATPVSEGDIRIAVIGDSWSVGNDLADPRSQAFPAVLGELVDATVTIHGQGRTGFVNAGYCGTDPYLTRVVSVLAGDPDVVVIEGGLNDVGLEGVGPAAEAVIRALGDVEVVVVGPVDVPKFTAEETGAVDAELQRAAASTGATYLSGIGAPVTISADKLHPTAEGQRTLAEMIAPLIG